MTDAERAASLERMMTAYGDGIKRFCALQLNDCFQAEDAAQDTFIKAWKALDRFRNECSEKTWLMKIAVRVCRDYQRTGWFRHMERRFTPEELPEACAEAPALEGEITQAVQVLPGRLRMAVLLRYYQGLTVQETASALDVSHATAKRMLKIANGILKEHLEGWYDDE